MQNILKDTYLSVIKGSAGTKMFQSSYFIKEGQIIDILEKGKLSCAFFVSSILKMFDMVNTLHATVDGLERDLEISGWEKIKEIRLGSILIWEKEEEGEHKHVGFYIGNNRAISNSEKEYKPKEHHITFGDKNNNPIRKIEAVYWNKRLY